MKKRKAQIFLVFYSVRNFGDDLFVELIGKNVPEADFHLIIHPRYPIFNLPSNIKVMKITSFSVSVLNKTLCMLDRLNLQKSKIKDCVYRLIQFIMKKSEKRFDASVEIGGSVFMQNNEGGEELDFTVAPEVERDYSLVCKNKKGSVYKFLIGANFGPYYSENYRIGVEKSLLEKTAVCLRDYSSYCLFKHLDNVQYAPDVVFTYDPVLDKNVGVGQKRALLSLINPSSSKPNRKIEDEEYFNLINESIRTLLDRGFLIDLVSFCEKEGDMEAVRKVVSNFHDCNAIKVHNYNGYLDEIIELFKQTDFVIASRFHSMVLGFIFQKPVFPIAYNCKTINYLADLNFTGKYAYKNNIADLTAADVLYNYDNRIICDVSRHRKYAQNQFYPLKQFLSENQ